MDGRPHVSTWSAVIRIKTATGDGEVPLSVDSKHCVSGSEGTCKGSTHATNGRGPLQPVPDLSCMDREAAISPTRTPKISLPSGLRQRS